ncbi:unnamed protein product [Colias eurytheme]|nr:unnamed protein product [Colias eurytheme]
MPTKRQRSKGVKFNKKDKTNDASDIRYLQDMIEGSGAEAVNTSNENIERQENNAMEEEDFLELVYDYAARNYISHPFKNGKAGDDWFSGFKRRHSEIVLRAPEPASLARTRGFNRPQVELFYSNYWSLIEKYNFDATTIYNMDETGIKSSTSKPPKLERLFHPFSYFERKRMQERLLDNAPPGSQATVTDNGWINGEAFMNWLQYFVEKVTFSVTNKRLQTINTSTYKGDLPQENRGGDRRSTKSEEKKQSLRNFLKALPAKESHYNRLKSKRIYLSSELNGAKLLRYYNSSVPANLRVSRSMFYDIFYKDFNIGFSCPSSDACNVCTLWSNKIKNECDPAKKQILMVEKRVHKLRANAFYQYMKDEVEGSISFCFDLQQVQPLPRTPIQDAFYSRQVSLYNFCIVDLKSKKPTFFTWNETQASRGSVEIGSALYTYLNGLDIPAEITTLRLFCDGCGGQNKNNHIIHMLLFWLHNNAPPHLRQINLTFPVRGHSFLPADRVFGRLEKEIRKFPVITTPKEYHKIFENHAKCHHPFMKALELKTKLLVPHSRSHNQGQRYRHHKSGTDCNTVDSLVVND